MRSWLFVPGDSERKLAKGRASGADVLILDLEDSVAAERKAAARGLVRDYIASEVAQQDRPQLYVRINPLTTEGWQTDLEEVMRVAPDGIMLPKSRSGEDVQPLALALSHAEQANGRPDGSTRILAIATEVAVSVLNLPSYLDASTRLIGLTWGAEDLSAEVGASSARDADGAYTSPFRLARDLTLFTAVAARIEPIDTVFVNFRNANGLAVECAEAARDGFSGKMAIHPDQVDAINRAFRPRDEDIARAREIVRLFAENPDAGVIGRAGEMLDRPHLLKAQRLIARAERS